MPQALSSLPLYVPIALAVAALVLVVRRIPYVGAAVRLIFSLALAGLLIVLIAERASFDPMLGRLAGRFEPDNQQVAGGTLRIRMARDGHFWANVRINGVRFRMLIDSGATVTAISQQAAAEAGIAPRDDLVPIAVTTANGTVEARAATVRTLRLGPITARGLKVIVSPAFGGMNVLGMNFLSKLKSWRVEDGILVMVPHHPQADSA
jgi:aspartyl protease family protein